MVQATTPNTLPNQIPAQTVPISFTDDNGDQVLDVHWYLFLYGLWTQVKSESNGGSPLPPAVNIPMVDLDVAETDPLQIARGLVNVAMLLPESDVGPSVRELATALALALDAQLPDAIASAQPSAAVTVGASPFTFTALFNGNLAVSGGAVSAIALIRQGVTVATGQTAGLIPVSRLDQVRITYTTVPTAVFLPS